MQQQLPETLAAASGTFSISVAQQHMHRTGTLLIGLNKWNARDLRRVSSEVVTVGRLALRVQAKMTRKPARTWRVHSSPSCSKSAW